MNLTTFLHAMKSVDVQRQLEEKPNEVKCTDCAYVEIFMLSTLDSALMYIQNETICRVNDLC